jgi:hypothetical protein
LIGWGRGLDEVDRGVSSSGNALKPFRWGLNPGVLRFSTGEVSGELQDQRELVQSIFGAFEDSGLMAN